MRQPLSFNRVITCISCEQKGRISNRLYLIKLLETYNNQEEKTFKNRSATITFLNDKVLK